MDTVLAVGLLALTGLSAYRNVAFWSKNKGLRQRGGKIPRTRQDAVVSPVGTVVVTGGLGFLGREIVKQLLEDNNGSEFSCNTKALQFG